MLKYPLLIAITIAISTSAEAADRAHASAISKESNFFAQTSIEKGWQKAIARQKPLLVMFTSDSCVHCRKMLTQTYGHPAIQRMLAANTETVLAHSKDYRALVKRLGIRGYPSSLLVSPQGDMLDFMEGYVDAKTFASRVAPLLKQQRTARQSKPTSTTALPLSTSDR